MPTISKINEIDLGKLKLKILVYGPWGSGKTWFMGTAPHPHFICTEEGLSGLAVAKVEGTFAVCKSTNDLLNAISDVANGRVPGAETICLDGISEITPILVQEVREQSKKQTLGKREWGMVVDNLRMAMRGFTALSTKYHLIASARSVSMEDEETENVYGTIDTVGKYREACPGAFDMVLFARQESFWKEGKRYAKWTMNTVDYAKFPAKDRTGTLDLVEPNDFPTILAKFSAGKRATLVLK